MSGAHRLIERMGGRRIPMQRTVICHTYLSNQARSIPANATLPTPEGARPDAPLLLALADADDEAADTDMEADDAPADPDDAALVPMAEAAAAPVDLGPEADAAPLVKLGPALVLPPSFSWPAVTVTGM